MHTLQNTQTAYQLGYVEKSGNWAKKPEYDGSIRQRSKKIDQILITKKNVTVAGFTNVNKSKTKIDSRDLSIIDLKKIEMVCTTKPGKF